ncbi:CIS tube protein [Mucilaginibacter glaciei]
MDVDYKNFTPDGAPLSAKVSLSFKSYRSDASYAIF